MARLVCGSLKPTCALEKLSVAVFDVGGMSARSRIRALYFPKETQEACEEEMESGACHEVPVYPAQVISKLIKEPALGSP